MENEKQTSPLSEEVTVNKVLIGILLKLRECEQEFYEQMEIIDKQNSNERDAEKEGKFYAGISDCMASVGYYIGDCVKPFKKKQF
ncbi:hypothetical protein EZS27_021463 [termite gut metagenome]|uniref:Uncharacterized protein n=2 Tax=root TaxID=1 RepID=A0A5M8NX64_9BACT|nr:MAG: hypothetical protein EZS26_002497 [Candidatus Ordinivivax streblomastigis]